MGPWYCLTALRPARLAEGDSLELPGLLSERGKSAPVIFITATDTTESRDRARSAGAAAYSCKPVDQQALLDAIAWAMSDGPPTGWSSVTHR